MNVVLFNSTIFSSAKILQFIIYEAAEQNIILIRYSIKLQGNVHVYYATMRERGRERERGRDREHSLHYLKCLYACMQKLVLKVYKSYCGDSKQVHVFVIHC